MRYGVFGAGIIGSYFGGKLARAGHAVVLVGREDLVAGVAALGGVEVADEGGDPELAPLEATTDPAALAGCDRVLVTVKATATAEAARALAACLPAATPVTSLQNGVRNRAVLAERLGEGRTFAGMVTFNAVREGAARFRRTTSGPVRVGGPPGIADDLRAAGLDAADDDDMDGILWGKLLFNLGNAVGALTGLTLPDAIGDADCRAVSRRAMLEGLRACRAAGVRPRGFGRLRPAAMARLLALPTPVLLPLVRHVIRTDPRARTSMWDDLQRGRPTEVDLINGEVVRLGEAHGVETPVNRALRDAVREAEARGPRPAAVTAGDLRRRVLG